MSAEANDEKPGREQSGVLNFPYRIFSLLISSEFLLVRQSPIPPVSVALVNHSLVPNLVA